jgi:TonB-linked SusC/RagA family outer membrane protein
MKKLMLLFAIFGFLGLQVYAQTTVTGTVTDDLGSGLPGVSVLVKGTTMGTMTLNDGTYSLNVPENSNALVFSYIGMKTQEVNISGSTINVVMKPDDSEMLDEFVVTAMGIDRQSKGITTAIQQVTGDDLTKVRETNIVNSLSGKIAGIQITNSSGAPGSSSRIVLRGSSSINGGSAPLFVVDGVPIDNTNYGTSDYGGGYDLPNGAAEINPDDIESISVLKGPVAAALYGNRAANGVILVTTKTGKETKGLGVSVNYSMTFENPLRLPDFQNSYGQGPSSTFFEFTDGQHGYGDGVDESWGAPLDIGLNFVQWNDYETGAPSPWVAYPDNIKDFYETGVTMNSNIAITGGDKDKSFRMSFTNMDQKGIIPNTDLTRTNVNGAGDIKVMDKLSVSFKANYTKSHSDNLVTQGYDNENPVQQMIWSGRNVNLIDLADYENLPLADPSTAAAGTPLNWNTVFQNNPYWVQYTNLTVYDKDRITGSGKATYQFTKDFSGYVRTGIDSWSSRIADRQAIGTNSAPYGSYTEIARRSYEWNTDYLLSYGKKIGDFKFDINYGGNMMVTEYVRITGSIPGIELPGVYNLSNLKSGNTPGLSNFYSKSAINSMFGFGQISFKDYLFVDFSARNDWWSVLPIDNNSYLYPSVSMSAVITDMLQMDSKILRFLKIKAGWSQVGSSGALAPYSLNQVYAYRAVPWGSTPIMYNPATLNNPNIKPETTQGLEAGIDAKFFNNRLSLDFTYYNQVSKDLIVAVQVSDASGYRFAWDNIGEMSNQGIEVQFGISAVEAKDLTLDLKLNFATYNNEVVSLGELDAVSIGGQWNVSTQAREGYPFTVIFGPGYLKDPDGNIVHENGLPVLDETYRVLGDIQPDWTGGVGFDLSYKGLSLSALVDAKMGGDMYSMTTTWGRYAGVLEETLLGRETGIIGDGVMNIGTADAPIYVANNVVVTAEDYNKAAFSNDIAEGSVFDASYIKLRQATLSYTVPSKFTSKVGIKNLNIGIIGRNLALLYSRIPHIDPESAFSSDDANQGLEFGQLPSVRSYGFSVNFKF